MTKIRRFPTVVFAALCASCSSTDTTDRPAAFTGATVWDGTGAAPVSDATIVVRDGRVVSVESAGAVPRGAQVVDLAGMYVTPGLINAHGHVSGSWADDTVEDEVERVRANLDLLARYGVTAVNSLGDEPPVLAARDAASPLDARARLFAAGPAITDFTTDGARAMAIENADDGVDWLKIRVDDNLETSPKMPWDAAQAVFDVADMRDLRVATHLFYLDDAKRLLEMGTGLLAHSVRDVDVDDEFVTQLRASGVCYVPTLMREVSAFTYAERPSFFDDPFFNANAHAGQLARVSEPAFMSAMATSDMATGYRAALEVALRNVKALSDAGLPVAMGTDAGPAGRFPGYFEHMELWMMVDAGLTPEQALMSATSVAASCLGADDIGTLEAGKWADFIVFGDDPLADIRATRSLEAVYIGGSAVN
jgi:imidazolonepropionase-like amidohydrolase